MNRSLFGAVGMAGWLSMAAAFPFYAAPPQKPLIDCDREELVRAVPELANLRFDANQDHLAALLQQTGASVDGMLAKLVDLSAGEDVNEMRFAEGVAGTSRRETFRYGVKVMPASFREFRVDARSGAIVQPASSIEFLVLSHFLQPLRYFASQSLEDSRFRYEGRWTVGGQDLFVVAFAHKPDSPDVNSHIQEPLQGLAWIDADTKRIVRQRLGLLKPVEDFPLETVTTDITFVPVAFNTIGSFWLPDTVTVDATVSGGNLHSVHRFSDYRAENEKIGGVPAVAPVDKDDAYESVARGISLVEQRKISDAILLLRDVVARHPDMAAARYNLGNALRAAGDPIAAQAEYVDTLKLVPNSGIVHNSLGLLLSKQSNFAGAAAEFRKSAELKPAQPIVHFNLAQMLEKSGDRAGALQEYKTASELAPDNAAFKTRYQQFEAGPTISVKVRQVLVPVIVTDKDGHHVTGLTQADFQVYEDGVEQKISAFSVENEGDVIPAAAHSAPPSNAKPGDTAILAPPAQRTPVRRTYVICIDSTHSALGHLLPVRKALLKLFESERPGDSQYVVLAMGTSTQVIQNTTTDPQKVLQAIESKDFQKTFLASGVSVEQAMVAFRTKLDEVKTACDTGDPECQWQASLPSEANEIASEQRTYDKAFLTQFHSLVEQLSRAQDRRTVVLISDGFQRVPGKEADDLMVAYFPGLRPNTPRPVEMMPELDATLRLAANRNIPIYTIDSRGLYTQPNLDVSNTGGGNPVMMPVVMNVMNSTASDAGATLAEIAAATGGTAFQNSNDLLTGLQRAFADGREYYTLAYVPPNNDPDGKFHSISVRLREAKLVANAKRGYWAN